MSENNHLSEQILDLDSQSNGVNTESNIDTYQNQVHIPNNIHVIEIGIM